jgi:hypothetical protein
MEQRGTTLCSVGVLVIVAVLGISGTATAQGRGRGVGRPQASSSTVPARTGGPTSTAALALHASLSFPQFGAWLDDASTVAAGAGYASVGTAYWRGSGADQINAPVLGATYGVTDRAQLSASVPFYRVRYDGYSGGGLESVYVSGKFALVTPDANSGGFRLALGAVAEILSASVVEGGSRAHWAIPVSVEFRASTLRLYGSTGYFSRGAFFAGGAVEWTAQTGTSLTGSFTHSQSAHGVTMATAATVPHEALREANLSVSQSISNSTSVYGAVARTFSTTGIDGASSVGAGLSFRFAGH